MSRTGPGRTPAPIARIVEIPTDKSNPNFVLQQRLTAGAGICLFHRLLSQTHHQQDKLMNKTFFFSLIHRLNCYNITRTDRLAHISARQHCRNGHAQHSQHRASACHGYGGRPRDSHRDSAHKRAAHPCRICARTALSPRAECSAMA